WRFAPRPVQAPPDQGYASELSREDRRADLEGEGLGEVADGLVHTLRHLEQEHVPGPFDDAEFGPGDQRAKLLGELRRCETVTAAAQNQRGSVDRRRPLAQIHGPRRLHADQGGLWR